MIRLDDVVMHREAIAALARRFGWRLVVLFGSTAVEGAGRDVDLAVQPEAVPSLLQQCRWQAELEALFDPVAVDLVVVRDVTNPVTRFEVFRPGRLLYEAEEGLFDREQDRAFFLYADSEKFRRASREILRDE
ncbi:nucleotidyltransferase family protein [Endothiovibrio diazotrophicus]